MTSEVAICNLALSNLGKDNINDFADTGAEARACNQFYAHVRDTLLQVYPWRFAGKTASLAEVTNDKPGEWQYAYKRPNDCLKVRWLRREYSSQDLPDVDSRGNRVIVHVPYDIEGETIYCDLSPAFLRYTWRLVDPTKFTPLFVEALSWHLAVRFAMPLTRDPKIRADAYQLATATLATAAATDANEVRETSDIDSDFIIGRV
jgi:hypothetical protein